MGGWDARTLNLMNAIFPLFNVYKIMGGYAFHTVLRKKYRGKWYLWTFYRKLVCDNPKFESQVFSAFMMDIYLIMLLGKVKPKLMGPDGFVFVLDDDQRDEVERIRDIMQYPKLTWWQKIINLIKR